MPAARSETQASDLALGRRLRTVRRDLGFTLHDVERTSGGEIKASALSAYERGDRSVSMPRLIELAQFYRITPRRLLGDELVGERDPRRDAVERAGFEVELELAEPAIGIEAVALGRMAYAILSLRHEHPRGSRVTIRETDTAVVALMVGREEREVVERLRASGVLHGLPADQRTVGTGTGTMKRPPAASYSAC